MVDAPDVVSRALREAPPDQLAEAADRAIRSALGALRTDVFVADYRISGLWPVLDPDLPAGGFLACHTMAQRCFSSQQPVRDRGEGPCRLYLPLTVWGERLGVLLIELPTVPNATVDRSGDGHRRRPGRGDARGGPGDRPLPAGPPSGATDAWPPRCSGTCCPGAAWPPRVRAGRPAGTGVHGRWRPLRLVAGRRPAHRDGAQRRGQRAGASLLTAVTVNAMRNARRSGGGLVEQAELASDTVFYQHRGAAARGHPAARGGHSSPAGCGRSTPAPRTCCGCAGRRSSR